MKLKKIILSVGTIIFLASCNGGGQKEINATDAKDVSTNASSSATTMVEEEDLDNMEIDVELDKATRNSPNKEVLQKYADFINGQIAELNQKSNVDPATLGSYRQKFIEFCGKNPINIELLEEAETKKHLRLMKRYDRAMDNAGAK